MLFCSFSIWFTSVQFEFFSANVVVAVVVVIVVSSELSKLRVFRPLQLLKRFMLCVLLLCVVWDTNTQSDI